MYPLVINSHERLIVAPERWFEGIGEVDFSARTLSINVNEHGPSGLAWILDANGAFHALTWVGFDRPTLLQRIGVARRREHYALSEPARITVGELSMLVAGLGEAFDEAPMAADLRDVLSHRKPEDVVTREVMRFYLGG